MQDTLKGFTTFQILPVKLGFLPNRHIFNASSKHRSNLFKIEHSKNKIITQSGVFENETGYGV